MTQKEVESYKEHIPLIKRNDICTLDNCLVTEVRSKGEKYFLTCIYRFPSQSHIVFEKLCVNFDLLLNNINDEIPICSILIFFQILTLVALVGGKTTLLTLQVKKLTLSHPQQGIHKLLISQPMLQIILCHA